MSNRAILFMAWGQPFMEELSACMSEPAFPQYPVILVTDRETVVDVGAHDIQVVRTDFQLDLKARKAEMVRFLPAEDMTLLFLDTDTRVLGDISLGFEKAEQFGIAMAQAAHYTMEHFRDFGKIMRLEGLEPKGQLLYNSGVIFFHLNSRVRAVLDLFHRLARTYADELWSDQPYFTLAMELLGFNPYTLTTGFNHRAFGELISGEIKIWHSRRAVPDNVNELNPVFPRVYKDGRIDRHQYPVPRARSKSP